MTRRVRVRREVQQSVYAYMEAMIRAQDIVGPLDWLETYGPVAEEEEVLLAVARAVESLAAVAERRAGGGR
jgi:hypothetical protein